MFQQSVALAPQRYRPHLLQVIGWAMQLEQDGLARLETTKGQNRWILNIRVPDDRCLASAWHYRDRPARLQLHRSVIERQAPHSIRKIERVLARPLGRGLEEPVSTALLASVEEAYREASLRARERYRRIHRKDGDSSGL